MNYDFLNLGYKKYKNDYEDDEVVNDYSLSWEDLQDLETEEDDEIKENQRKLDLHYKEEGYERSICYTCLFVCVYLLMIVCL